jgi:hypothetical protein
VRALRPDRVPNMATTSAAGGSQLGSTRCSRRAARSSATFHSDRIAIPCPEVAHSRTTVPSSTRPHACSLLERPNQLPTQVAGSRNHCQKRRTHQRKPLSGLFHFCPPTFRIAPQHNRPQDVGQQARVRSRPSCPGATRRRDPAAGACGPPRPSSRPCAALRGDSLRRVGWSGYGRQSTDVSHEDRGNQIEGNDE